jgi:hypothetical protein
MTKAVEVLSHHRRRIDRVVAGTAVDEQLVGGILMHDAGGGYGDADAAVELNQPPVVAGNPPPPVPVRIEDISSAPILPTALSC